MIEWEDTTIVDKEKPNTFTAKSGQIKMTVTCKDSQYNGWVLHLFILSDSTYRVFPLKCKTLDEAKAKAVEIAKAEIFKLIEDAKALD